VVEHRVAGGVAPGAGSVGDAEADGGFRAVGELEFIEEAVGLVGLAGQVARAVVAVDVPEVIRGETSSGKAGLRAGEANAEVHVDEELRGSWGGVEQD